MVLIVVAINDAILVGTVSTVATVLGMILCSASTCAVLKSIIVRDAWIIRVRPFMCGWGARARF